MLHGRRLLFLLLLVPLAACSSSPAGPAGHADGSTGADSRIADAAVRPLHDLGTPGSPDMPAGPVADMRVGPSADMSPGCGTCPSGYACGTANGLPVCRDSATGIPLFGHVFVILMENTSLSTLNATPSAIPYISGLEKAWASGSDYHGVAHPSLPNYIALSSGSTQGIGCDCHPSGCACGYCFTPFGDSCACDQPSTVTNVADQIESAGLTWRAYAESMGAPCTLTDSGNFAARHVPFLYYDDIQKTSRCAADVVDYGQFATDLASSAGPRVFTYIAPNLIDDMHNPEPASSTNLTNGDTWLSNNLPPIIDPGMATSKYFYLGGLVVVVWDEDDGSGGITGSDDPIPILVLSPYARQGGYVSATHANHYSLLATFEDGLDLPRLGMAASATPLSDYFPTK